MPAPPPAKQADPPRGNLGPLLRRERFGGILFHPLDGTHLELDQSGFELLLSARTSGDREPPSEEERAFLSEVESELPAPFPPADSWRVFDLPPMEREYRNITVLRSPSLVDLQLTTRCRMGCPHCYASSSPRGEHLPHKDAVRVLEAIAEAGVFQLALGGGEPLLHPRIAEILFQTRALGMVPNLTTTGDGMTNEVLRAMAGTCGAVALSLEGVGDEFNISRRSGFAFFEESLERLRDHGISAVFQVTLSAETVHRLPSVVDYCLSVPDLYGVIFLAYKPVGRGERYHTPLSALEPAALYPELKGAFRRLAAHTRVGYDCCLTPGIVGLDRELGFTERDLLEGCSAARTSIGITTDLEVVPCTFVTHLPLGNLRDQSFEEIWRGERAHAFRHRLDSLGDNQETCRRCDALSSCLGGCPEWPLIRCLPRGETSP